jgi:hypothetical protein
MPTLASTGFRSYEVSTEFEAPSTIDTECGDWANASWAWNAKIAITPIRKSNANWGVKASVDIVKSTLLLLKGIALKPLKSGKGVIEVLATLQ